MAGRHLRLVLAPYRHLWHAVKTAEAEFKGINLQIIAKAARETWQAAAWLLERKHTDEFGRRERLAIEGTKDGAPVQVQTGGVIVLPPLGEGSE